MFDESAIVLIDGICVLCNGVAQFARKRMKPGRLEFLALQSDHGEAVLRHFGQATDQLDTFVLVEGKRCSVRSTAALRLLRHLRQPWPMLSVLLLIPRSIRDAVYTFVARRRYKWFGTCDLPAIDESAAPHENAGANERAGVGNTTV